MVLLISDSTSSPGRQVTGSLRLFRCRRSVEVVQDLCRALTIIFVVLSRLILNLDSVGGKKASSSNGAPRANICNGRRCPILTIVEGSLASSDSVGAMCRRCKSSSLTVLVVWNALLHIRVWFGGGSATDSMTVRLNEMSPLESLTSILMVYWTLATAPHIVSRASNDGGSVTPLCAGSSGCLAH